MWYQTKPPYGGEGKDSNPFVSKPDKLKEVLKILEELIEIKELENLIREAEILESLEKEDSNQKEAQEEIEEKDKCKYDCEDCCKKVQIQIFCVPVKVIINK